MRRLLTSSSGRFFDTLLLGNLKLLLGIDIRLVGIAEGVLEQELRTLRATLGLKQSVRRISLDPLESVVTDPAMLGELFILVIEVDCLQLRFKCLLLYIRWL